MRWLSHHRNHRCWNYCSGELWRRDENWLYLCSCKGVIFVCSHEIKMIKSVQFVHSGPISPSYSHSHSESRLVKCYQFCNELMIKSLQLLLVKHFRSNFLCSFQFPMQRFFIESFKWKWIWHFRANLNFQLFLWLLTCIMRKVKFMKNYGFLIWEILKDESHQHCIAHPFADSRENLFLLWKNNSFLVTIRQ